MKNICVIVLICFPSWAFSQTSVNISISLPSIALLDIAPNNTAFNLNLAAPTEAGNSVTDNPTNSSKWINFTSAVIEGRTRRITAQISGTLPAGVNLGLNIANYAGIGAGTLGISSGTVILSGTTQTVINNIGGAFTGDGANNGYNLTYILQISDYALLRTQTSTFTVLYTMADN